MKTLFPQFRMSADPAAAAGGGAAPAASTAAPPATSAALSAPAAAAPASGGAAGAAPTTETVNPGSWMAGFNDDMKGYVQNKGFKDPAMMADAYRNLEKLRGVPAERLLTLPERFYDDKGVMTPEAQAVFERLGAPKDGKYDLQLPKENADPKRFEAFTKLAKDIGLTKTQAEKILGMDVEYGTGVRQAMAEAAAQKFRDDDAVIKKEWGAAFEQERTIAADGMRKLGWDNAKVDKISSVLGHAETMRLLNQIGKATGEGVFVNGQRPNQVHVPADARSKINELKATPGFWDKLTTDPDTKAQWERLHREAYPGTLAV